MPRVRIDLVKGRSEARVRAVDDAVHAAVVEVLAVPERDRFQIITEHEASRILALDAGLGFERSDDTVMIHTPADWSFGFGRTPLRVDGS
ncbi:tautomerase family protein [Streptomyces hygroscopicus]|uniref:tautomerase family protein n=1 Tax=Streptomyces hygroscopicus TaxID=1912 RepID=UPI00099E6D83|nr:tautomerase family protein [Streptomyces hygroscopicus]